MKAYIQPPRKRKEVHYETFQTQKMFSSHSYTAGTAGLSDDSTVTAKYTTGFTDGTVDENDVVVYTITDGASVSAAYSNTN